jgi:hypothetical protein
LKYSGKQPLPKNCVFWKKNYFKRSNSRVIYNGKGHITGENAILTYTGSLGITSLNITVSIRTIMPKETATFLQWQFENEITNSSCGLHWYLGHFNNKKDIFLAL